MLWLLPKALRSIERHKLPEIVHWFAAEDWPPSDQSYFRSQQHFQKNSVAKDVSGDADDLLFRDWMLIGQQIKPGAYFFQLVYLVLKGSCGHFS